MNHLHNKNILLTRTPEQNAKTAELLRSFGANPVLFPCIQVTILPESIRAGLAQLQLQNKSSCDVIFSSANGVHAVAEQTDNLTDALAGTRIVAVGKKTALALKELGLNADMLPADESQAGLVVLYQQQGLPRQAFFFRAREGSDTLEKYFQAHGIPLSLIPCYDTTCNEEPRPEVIAQLADNTIDAILLGSAKTAQFYMERVGNPELANRPVVVVMSTQVAQAADKLGLNVQVIAEEPGFSAMLEGLNQYFMHQK